MKVGDKVKVISNLFPYMESFRGQTGVVDGSVTRESCVVKLASGKRRWFDLRELEKL